MDLKTSLKDLTKNGVINNMFYLSIMQVITYLFPLFVLPYLYRVFTIDTMGLLLFAQAFIQFAIVLCDYGFDLTATRDISINRGNLSKESFIFSSVIITKFLLFIISCIILIPIFAFVPYFSENKLIYILTLLMVFGQIIFPTWYFQGKEEMKYITYINLIMKTVGLLLVFIIVNKATHYYRYLLIMGIINLLTGLIGIYIAYKKFAIKLIVIGFNELRDNLKEGFHLFLSNISISLYGSANTVILGFMTNNVIVGNYSIVERPITAIRGFAGIIFRSIYPKACKMYGENNDKLGAFYKKIFIPIGIVFFFGGLILSYYSDYFVLLFSGESNKISSDLMKILAFVPLIVVINIPAYQSLILLKKQKIYFKILFSGAIISLLLNTILSSYFQAYGTAISILFIEIYITIGLYIIYLKKDH